jgi:hypothetical protein
MKKKEKKNTKDNNPIVIKIMGDHAVIINVCETSSILSNYSNLSLMSNLNSYDMLLINDDKLIKSITSMYGESLVKDQTIHFHTYDKETIYFLKTLIEKYYDRFKDDTINYIEKIKKSK